MAAPLVEMRDVTKRFSGVTANKKVSFSVEAGEVHALLGENGAGKSTLMNILYGLYRPDEGQVFVNGKRKTFRSPSDAIAAGIGMVHQHFMLAYAQTVWENMILGMNDTPFVLPREKIRDKTAELSERYGLQVDPAAVVWQLSTGEQQRVALLQMLYRNAKVLILDEPTAVLTPQESTRLFQTIRRMTMEGHGVVFISHKMNEVMNETHRVTVLHRGESVDTVKTSETTEEALTEMMVGQKILLGLYRKPINAEEQVFEVKDLHVAGNRGFEVVRGLSFNLRRYEILGVAGIAGNGQQELCEAMVGLRPVSSGSIAMNGKDITNAPPRSLIDQGVHYIPSDRKGIGMVTDMDVQGNSILRKYWSKPVANSVFINESEANALAWQIVDDFGVSTPSIRTPVKNLSGGNIQKLLMGRELSNSPEVVVVVHPTWGLDVAATRYVRERLLERRENGAAIFLISEDLDELMALSDRLAVMFKGKFMGIVDDPESAPIEKIGLMMAGSGH